jgi:hypothetical protein
MRFAPALLIALGVASPSYASGLSERGNSLLELCQEREGSYRQGVCTGYILGAADAVREATCMPAGVTKGQLRDVVVGYLTAHPEERHMPGDYLVHVAIANAFKCP